MFCLEHRIQSDEKIVLGKIIGGGGDDCFNIFFSEIGKWIHVVRSVFFDLEHDVVRWSRNSNYWQLLYPEQLISGKEDAANNY